MGARILCRKGSTNWTVVAGRAIVAGVVRGVLRAEVALYTRDALRQARSDSVRASGTTQGP